MKYLLFLVLMPTIVFGSDFCNLENLNEKSKTKKPVKEFSSEVSKLGKVLISNRPEDCKFIKDSKNKEDYIFIDARGHGARGFISGAVKVISDHDDQASHQFKQDVFEKKITTYLTKKNKKSKNPKHYKYVIFCNGPTCYRTSWAACSLNKMGYKPSQLNLVLDGFMGLKKDCMK